MIVIVSRIDRYVQISKRFFTLLDLYQNKSLVQLPQKHMIICFNLWARMTQRIEITYAFSSTM